MPLKIDPKMAKKLAEKHREDVGEVGGKKLELRGAGDPDFDRSLGIPVLSWPSEEELEEGDKSEE